MIDRRKRVFESFRRICLLTLTGIVFSGCTDLKMVNAPAPEEEDRSDVMRMTGVVADLTSSGTVQRRVVASSGSFSESRGLLLMNDVRVDSFDTSGVKQGTTQAKIGRSYFQNQGERTRGDIEFTTNVLHTAPDKTNPTTNAIEMKSNHILWNDKEQRYESLTPYEMQIRAKGNPPLILRGGGFHTTADMLKWSVIGGAMTTDRDKDLVAEREQVRSEMWDIAARADAETDKIAGQNRTRQKISAESLPSELQGEPEPLKPGNRLIEPTTATMAGTTITTQGRQVAKIPPRAPSQPKAAPAMAGETTSTPALPRPGSAGAPGTASPAGKVPDAGAGNEDGRTARFPGAGRRRPLTRPTTGTGERSATRTRSAQSGNE